MKYLIVMMASMAAGFIFILLLDSIVKFTGICELKLFKKKYHVREFSIFWWIAKITQIMTYQFGIFFYILSLMLIV